MTEQDTVARTLAALGLVGVALIHVLELPDAFSEQAYLGALFIVASVAALLFAAALARTDDSRAWAAAGGLSALILLGYVIDRSVGLPGMPDEVGVWDDPLGLAAMVVEGLVVFVSAGVLLSRANAREPVVEVDAPSDRRPRGTVRQGDPLRSP